MSYRSKNQLLEISTGRMSYCNVDPQRVVNGESAPCRLHAHPEYNSRSEARRVAVMEGIDTNDFNDDPDDDIVSVNEYDSLPTAARGVVIPEGMRTDDFIESLGDDAAKILHGDTLHKEYAVIDFETTGGRAEGADRGIQLAIIHVDENGNITDRWMSFINPEREVDFVDKHGITQEMAESGPKFHEIADEIQSRLDGRVIAAHNASFDLRFVQAEFARLGVHADIHPANTFCTMQSAKRFLGDDIPSTKLADCLEVTGLSYVEEDGRGAHDAQVDATATARLLAHFLKKDPDAFMEERIARIAKAEEKAAKKARDRARAAESAE
jgi:DNA polymerase III epsilon subunit family exonuclease